jgi:hypothetical protein
MINWGAISTVAAAEAAAAADAAAIHRGSVASGAVAEAVAWRWWAAFPRSLRLNFIMVEVGL